MINKEWNRKVFSNWIHKLSEDCPTYTQRCPQFAQECLENWRVLLRCHRWICPGKFSGLSVWANEPFESLRCPRFVQCLRVKLRRIISSDSALFSSSAPGSRSFMSKDIEQPGLSAPAPRDPGLSEVQDIGHPCLWSPTNRNRGLWTEVTDKSL